MSALVLACGALAREMRAVIDQAGLDHIDLHCLPAELHNSPQDIPDAVRRAVEKFRGSYDNIMLAYADCGTGGSLQSLCNELGLTMIQGPHCYAFFQMPNMAAKDPEHEPTHFFLTDFLARQFDAFVWKPLGLDQHPELLPMYFGNYTRLVYLAQTDDDALTEKAQEAATRLGLDFERRQTGYGLLSDWVQSKPEPQLNAGVQS